MNTILPIFAFLFLLPSVFGGYKLVQAPLPNDPMQVRIYQLDNGLTVYLTENREEPTFRSEITVRAGSKDDPADATGLAHYLEHLLFKGNHEYGTTDWEKERPHIERIEQLYQEHYHEEDPEKRAAIYEEINKESQLAAQYAIPNEFDKALSAMGAQGMNAYTASDRTVYLVEMPANRLEQWARIEASRFQNPVFRLFQPELEIVYEEKNRAMDNKDRLIGNAVYELLYGEHPYGSQTAIGTIDHLKRPRLRVIHEFFDKHYVANNMAVALSGDFVAEEAIKVIDRHFSAWKSGPIPTFDRPMPKPLSERQFVEIQYPGEEFVLLGFPTVPVKHADVPALKLLDMILSNAAAGLIDLNLNQAQRVLKAGCYPYLRNDAGTQFFYGIPKDGQSLEEVEQLLLEQIELVKSGQFEDWIIPAIINDFKKNDKKAMETNQGRLGVITESFGSYQDWKDVVSEIAALEALTKEDVMRVANVYLGADYVAGYRRNGPYAPPSVEKPKLDPIDIDRSRQSAFMEAVLSSPVDPIAPEFVETGKDYQVLEVRDGVRLFYVKNPVNDLFSLTRLYEMGTREIRELGIAAAMLDKSGTGSRTAEELKLEWYKLGATFAVTAGDHVTGIDVSGLDENFDATMALFQEAMEDPVMEEGVFKQLIEITLKKRENRKKDFNAIFAALRSYNRYGEKSPFLSELTAPELQSLALGDMLELIKDLKAYQHDYLYVGSLAPEAVASKLRAMETEATLKEVVAREGLTIRNPAAHEVLYLDYETAQAQLRLEFPDGPYAEENQLAINFFNEYFYGGMGGIVFQEMREARALAYSVWAYYLVAPYAQDQSLVMGFIGTQADKTVDALRAYAELWDGMPRSEQRFAETAAALENQYRVGHLPFRAILPAVKEWERLGLAKDPRAARFEGMGDFSLESLFAFYESNIQGRPKLISVLGPSAAIDIEQLKSFGEVKVVTVEDIFAK